MTPELETKIREALEAPWVDDTHEKAWWAIAAEELLDALDYERNRNAKLLEVLRESTEWITFVPNEDCTKVWAERKCGLCSAKMENEDSPIKHNIFCVLYER